MCCYRRPAKPLDSKLEASHPFRGAICALGKWWSLCEWVREWWCQLWWQACAEVSCGAKKWWQSCRDKIRRGMRKVTAGRKTPKRMCAGGQVKVHFWPSNECTMSVWLDCHSRGGNNSRQGVWQEFASQTSSALFFLYKISRGGKWPLALLDQLGKSF